MANCNNVRQNETCSGREIPGTNFSDAVCIHTDKIYDSCRDKDCLENIRVYLTSCGQEVVDRAINVKVTRAEVIWVFTDVELTYVARKQNRIGMRKKQRNMGVNIVKFTYVT